MLLCIVKIIILTKNQILLITKTKISNFVFVLFLCNSNMKYNKLKQCRNLNVSLPLYQLGSEHLKNENNYLNNWGEKRFYGLKNRHFKILLKQIGRRARRKKMSHKNGQLFCYISLITLWGVIFFLILAVYTRIIKVRQH